MTNYSLATKALADFNAFMDKYGSTFTVTRLTETTDSMGTVSSISESEFSVIGVIQDISYKDRIVHDMGLAVPGNRKFFCKVLATDGTNEVKEGDLITDANGVQWKVTNIIKQPYVKDTQIYKYCIIKSITLEGS